MLGRSDKAWYMDRVYRSVGVSTFALRQRVHTTDIDRCASGLGKNVMYATGENSYIDKRA